MKSLSSYTSIAAAVLVAFAGRQLPGQVPEPKLRSLVRTVDLAVGEARDVELCDGSKAKVKLLDLQERRDTVCDAVREARVEVEVNGRRVWLTSATYRLPTTIAGVQIDCPITKGYLRNATQDVWALERDARLRLWPAGSPLIEPGTFIYPAKQRWFASQTQMANDPVFVDSGERPKKEKVYYHWGLDIGGPEGLVEVVAATDALVVSSGKASLPGYEATPARSRYDVIYLLDDRGWFYRYSHLKTIDKAIQPGARIAKGTRLGLLGKEGGSGGWSHLHFDISSIQPSGKYGIHEGYAYLWEAYLAGYRPPIIAVARPHHVAWVGDKVVLDGSRSWSSTGTIANYEWRFTDAARATGAVVERTYAKPGVYSEILKVADGAGNLSYDFAYVEIFDKDHPDQIPPSIHAAYAPTFGIKPGTPLTFKVRTFGTTDGVEVWDFGDGTPPITVKSDGNVNPLAPEGYAEAVHTYARSGDYIARVQRTDGRGRTAIAHLWIPVHD